MTSSQQPRLYLITPPQFELQEFAVRFRDALRGGDVACVQLRMKDGDGNAVDDELIIAATKILMPIVHEYEAQFIINDSPKLAHELDADGVHVGEDDGSVAKARAIVGEDKVVGCSCYDSRHRAMEAVEQGADYVAFGAFYPTQTKAKVRRPSVDILDAWSTFCNVPCVAIGGIKPDNLAPLVEAGADFIAVVTGVWDYPDGAKAGVAEYNKAIAEAL